MMVIDEDLAHQVRNVLRMHPGDEILLFGPEGTDGYGFDFRFQITRLTDRVLDGDIIAKIKNDREPRITFTLYQAILKKDKMEWIFEKGTEVGVARFVPIVSERAIKHSVNPGRAKKIIQEAAEQSGRACLPRIAEPVNFSEAVAVAKKGGGLNVFAHEKEVRSQLGNLPLANQTINLFIGPEGGFSEKEADEARTAGFFVTSLSRRILRAETAAVSGSYFLIHRFGN